MKATKPGITILRGFYEHITAEEAETQTWYFIASTPFIPEALICIQ
jgi:hypothetical protein